MTPIKLTLVITNNGLISAQAPPNSLSVSNADWLIQPLASDHRVIYRPESTLVVPLLKTRLGSGASAASTISGLGQINLVHVFTPTQSNYYSTPLFIYNAEPGQLRPSAAHTVLPTRPIPVPPSDWVGATVAVEHLRRWWRRGRRRRGGGFGNLNGFSSSYPFVSPPNYQFVPPIVGAIVDVVLQIDQTAVISRDAFKATLRLNNNSGSPITDLEVTTSTRKDASGEGRPRICSL